MFRVFNCLATQHDLRLVVVAGIICFLSSLTAITLFNRARAMAGKARLIWIAAAGAASGCGIWSTHFVAMLAYDPDVPVAYSINFTIMSLMAAAIVTGLGLAVAVFFSRPFGALVGGAIIGIGVACMHYLGMSALELPGHIAWELPYVAASIVIGVVLAMAALTVAERSRSRSGLLFAALLLTLAIVSHHFTAMGAVDIVPDPMRRLTEMSLSPASLALAIASIAAAILGMSLISAFADRRLDDKGRLLELALNDMTQGVVLFDSSGRLLIRNDRYLQMYDLSAQVVNPGAKLADIVRHRAQTGSLQLDAQQYYKDLIEEMAGGKDLSFIAQSPDGRSISVVNRPIPTGGYWVGTHDYITERLPAEQKSLKLTEQQARRAVVDDAIGWFRGSVEGVLKTVTESVATMKSTATVLSTMSNETTAQTTGAVRTSNDAFSGVESAAAAADELSKSIAEDQPSAGQRQRCGRRRHRRSANDEHGHRRACPVGAKDQRRGQAYSKRGRADQSSGAQCHNRSGARRDCRQGFRRGRPRGQGPCGADRQGPDVIAAQINAVQSSTQSAVRAIGSITNRTEEIRLFTSAIATSVEQQNAATGEISDNVTAAATGTRSVVGVLQKVSIAISDMHSSADTVLKASSAVGKGRR
ncbi:MAG: MHYT domain-containing protein [Xanthobacteraceae bacterium]